MPSIPPADSSTRDTVPSVPTAVPVVPTEGPQVVTNVRMRKAASAASVEAGGTFQYILEIANTSAAAATDVVVEDAVPQPLAVINLQSGKGDIIVRDGIVHAYPRDLAPGERVEYVITVQVPENAVAGFIENTALVTTSTPGDDPGDNSSSVRVTITRPSAPTVPQILTAPPRLPRTSEGGEPELLVWLAQLSPLVWLVGFAVMLLVCGIVVRQARRTPTAAPARGAVAVRGMTAPAFQLPVAASIPPPLLGPELPEPRPPAPLPALAVVDRHDAIRDARRGAEGN